MKKRTAWMACGISATIALAALPVATAAHAATVAPAATLTTVHLGGGDVVVLPNPARLLDTTHGVGANRTVSFVVAGRGGVPAAGVSAVVGRVRVIAPSVVGSATVYPNGGARPSARTLQFGKGASRETLTVALIGAGGRVVLHNESSRALRFVFDATGYVPDTAEYTPLPAPRRVLSATAAPLAARAAKTFAVGGTNEIPASGVGAVFARVTVFGPTTNGTATLYPAGHGRPGPSTLAWHAGAPTETLTVLALGSAGKLTLHNGAARSARFTVDVLGFLSDTSTFHVLNAPARLLSTKNGVGAAAHTIAAGSTVTVKIAGRSGIPTSGIGSVVARVGVFNPVVAGAATVYRAHTTRPRSSDLAYAAGATANTLTVVRLSSDGKVTLHNGSRKPAHFTLDVLGWFAAVSAAQQSTKFVLPATTRPRRTERHRRGQRRRHIAHAAPECRRSAGWWTPVDTAARRRVARRHRRSRCGHAGERRHSADPRGNAGVRHRCRHGSARPPPGPSDLRAVELSGGPVRRTRAALAEGRRATGRNLDLESGAPPWRSRRVRMRRGNR